MSEKIWSNTKLHALINVLRKAGTRSYSFSVTTSAGEVQVFVDQPRGYRVVLTHFKCKAEGYHGSLSDDEIERAFGFTLPQVAELYQAVISKVDEVALQNGVSDALADLLVEWSFNPKTSEIVRYSLSGWDITLNIEYPEIFGKPVMPDIEDFTNPRGGDLLVNWPGYGYLKVIDGLPAVTSHVSRGLVTVKVTMRNG